MSILIFCRVTMYVSVAAAHHRDIRKFVFSALNCISMFQNTSFWRPQVSQIHLLLFDAYYFLSGRKSEQIRTVVCRNEGQRVIKDAKN